MEYRNTNPNSGHCEPLQSIPFVHPFVVCASVWFWILGAQLISTLVTPHKHTHW